MTVHLAAEVYRSDELTPSKRAELYEKYFLQSLAQKGVDLGRELPKIDRARTTLKSIAWHLNSNGNRDVNSVLQAIQNFSRETPDEASKQLNMVRDELSMLALKDDRYSFNYHETIQEYFVAKRLQQAWERDPLITWNYLRPRLHLAEWKEPLMLLISALEGEKERRKFILKVRHARSRYERRLHRDFLLAASLMGEIGVDDPKLLKPYLKQANSTSATKRETAIEALGNIGCDESISVISDVLLHDKNIDVRIKALEALRKFREQAVPVFLQALKTEPDWSIRCGIVSIILREIGNQDAIDAIIQTYNSDPHGSVRWNAIYALGEIGDLNTLPIIIQALLDEDGDVVGLARDTLSKFGPKAIPQLRQALIDYQDKNNVPVTKTINRDYAIVRACVAKTLGEIGSSDAIQDLLQLLNDNRLGVVNAAIEALEQIGDPKVIDDLRKDLSKRPNILEKGNEDTIFRSKPETLEKFSVHLDVTVLLRQALKDDDSRMRKIAFQALGNIGDESVVHDLIEFVREDYYRDGLIGGVDAINALGKIRDKKAVKILIDILEDMMLKGNFNFSDVMRALAEIGDEKAIPVLIRIAEDANVFYYIRCDALDALGKIGGSIATNKLAQIFQTDANFNIRESAITALSDIGDPNTIEIFIAALHTHNEDLSWYWIQVAAEALGKIGDPKAVPSLIEALKNPHADVSWKSAVALGLIFNNQEDRDDLISESLPALVEVLENADKNFNWDALQFIGPIKDKKAVPILMKIVREQYGGVANWAMENLIQIGDLQAIPTLIGANAQDAIKALIEKFKPEDRKKGVKIITDLSAKLERKASQELLSTLSNTLDKLTAPIFDPLNFQQKRPISFGHVIILGALFCLAEAGALIFTSIQSVLGVDLEKWVQSQPIFLIIILFLIFILVNNLISLGIISVMGRQNMNAINK